MSRYRLQILLCGLGAAGLGLIVWTLLRPSEPVAQPALPAAVKSAEPIEPARAIKPERSQVEVDRPGPLQPTTPAPETSLELSVILAKLRESYEAGGSKPNRFRLQRQLSTRWGDTPPVDLLLYQSSDASASPEYRAHFARRLLKLGKIAPPESRQQLAGEMRDALAVAPSGSPGLAQALVAFDDSPMNIGAVKQQLDRPHTDQQSAGLVAALTLSNSPEARTALWDHSRAIADEPDRFPRTLVAALPPLARVRELEVEPVLQRVLAASSNLPLYETAIESCFARHPSESSLAVIRLAYQRSTQFDGDQQKRLQGLLRAGLLRWQRQSADSTPAQNLRIETLFNQI